MRWWRLLVAVAVVGGCGGGADQLSPSSSTSVDYSVPEVIEHTYVTKVVFALDQVYGDALRTLARERAVTDTFRQRLSAVYAPAELPVVLATWEARLAVGRLDLGDPPMDPGTKVERTLRLDPGCIVVLVRRDFRALRSTVLPMTFLVLEPSTAEHRLNPTPWVISFDGAFAALPGVEPEEPCGSRRAPQGTT